MNLKNYYWVFERALTPRFCEEVRLYGDAAQKEMGLTGNTDPKKLTEQNLKDIKKKRDSDIVWMNEAWIYNEIEPYVKRANKNAGWNFKWYAPEPCQFTEYKPGQYYGWHSDDSPIPLKRPNQPTDGMMRKLSVTCSLSHPSEYSGGELEFNFNNPERTPQQNIKKCTEILPQGSVVVFPSFLWHRVCPVFRGTRYSLVIWHLGYPYQ